MDEPGQQQLLSMSQSSLKSSPPASSPSTTVTTPEQSAGEDDDIWDTSSDYHGHEDASHHDIGLESTGLGSASASASASAEPLPRSRRGGEILSDVPSLRRQHMTDGYREGLGVGKARVMQDGFDAGYPFGVELGGRVGRVLGVLEGIVSAAASASASASASARAGTVGGAGGAGGGAATAATATTAGPAGGFNVRMSASQSVTGGTRKSATGSPSQDIPSFGLASTSTSTSNAGDTTHSPADIAIDVHFVRKLYERAKEELKISELLKRLDDAKIAEMQDPYRSRSRDSQLPEDAVSTDPVTQDDYSLEDAQKGNQSSHADEPRHGHSHGHDADPVISLPQEIETVVAKWERIVLRSLSSS